MQLLRMIQLSVVQTLARGPHAARERFLYAVYYTKS